MSKNESKSIVPDEVVITKIHFIRDQKVMLDYNLADLYGVETRVLKQAVKRNINRFTDLSQCQRSQIGSSGSISGGRCIQAIFLNNEKQNDENNSNNNARNFSNKLQEL
jgi:hypothetical protein